MPAWICRLLSAGGAEALFGLDSRLDDAAFRTCPHLLQVFEPGSYR